MEKKETYSYKGWLNSDSFIKRAFAVYGYSMVAGLIVALPIYLLFFIVGMVVYFLTGVR